MSGPSLEFGPALHCGDVMYGNIGVAAVIGAAANQDDDKRCRIVHGFCVHHRLACAIQRLGWMTLREFAPGEWREGASIA